MTRGPVRQMRAMCLVLGALALFCVSRPVFGQGEQGVTAAQTAQLLGKAHALEVRGRMDMAKQTWQQVLLVDPNNSDALAGMARAAKLEGKTEEANQYLNKLRSINPNDPNIARVEQMGTSQDQSAQLQEAGRLAQAGQYARAMAILRQVYGATPPAGDAALSYYETEAATEDGRPHAIAGLRELMDKYPQDSRYQITLGKILTYNPRTRAEGRKLLEKHPNDPDAVEALRQSLVWDAQNPATSGDLKSYLAKHKDAQLQSALEANEATIKRSGGRPAAAPPTPEQEAQQAAIRARSAELQAAYNALNAKHYDDAEVRFQAIAQKEPQNAQALAGLGYIRMSQSNFGGAISYFEQSIQDGSKDAGVEKALRDSRFFYTMQVATSALNENDLSTAQIQFQNAARMRPNDATPLLGLGGTLMKAQQPMPAIHVFEEYVRMAPGDKAAWRGLFMAQYGAQQYLQALDTDRRIPAGVKKQLIHDPEYLRTLASVYQALGRDADAQRVLRSALEMPFPADSRGMRADIQLQYAALLAAANHYDQAAGLYRQVLEADSTNTAAYEGLINMEHVAGQDPLAFQAIQSMPPPTYETAMQEPGFQSTVAAIYHSQGHDDLAQQVLETSLANQAQQGQPANPAVQLQLAGIYLAHGDTARAYPLFASALQQNPDRPDAWNGLLSSMHASGHDQEALAEIQQIPPNVRVKLERDPAYLQTVGSIYSGLNQPQAAMMFFNRVQQHYAGQHMAPPADVDIQEAWLLFNAHNDAMLFRQLMMLGGRQDLTDEQRLTVQTIWANWAVRRANQNIDEGNYKRAIAILNAAAKAFPGNPDVLKALASGYATAGLAHQAVKIYKSQDLSTGTVQDYRAAVGSALSDNDLKDAETWLRFGLDQYPRDGALLGLAAKFETARGDTGRAADYLKASLAVLPEDDPGLELSAELNRPVVRRVVKVAPSQDLATMLSQPDPSGRANALAEQPVERPYLPSYNQIGGVAPIQIVPQSAQQTQRQQIQQQQMQQQQMMQMQQPTPTEQQQVLTGRIPATQPTSLPSNQTTGTYPGGATPSPGPITYPPVNGPPAGYTIYGTPAQQQNNAAPQGTTLRDYVPQSRLEVEPSRKGVVVAGVLHLTPSPEMEAKYGPYVSYDPSEGLPQSASTVAYEHQETTARISSAAYFAPQTSYPETSYPVKPKPVVKRKPTSAGTATRKVTTAPAVTATQAKPQPIHLHLPPPVKTASDGQDAKSILGPNGTLSPYAYGEKVQQTAPYPQPTANTGVQNSAAQNATRRPTVTQDGTPILSYLPNSTSSKQTTHAKAMPRPPSASVTARAQAIKKNQEEAPEEMTGQAHPPVEVYETEPDAQMQNTQFSPAGAQGAQVTQAQAPKRGSAQTSTTITPDLGVNQTGDSTGQQYPQPNTRGTVQGTTGTTPRRRVRSTPQTSSTTETPAPAPTVVYPGYQPPLTNQAYPQVGTPYPLGTPPSDYELQQRNVPPLRGYFDPRVDDKAPLTDRQQAELDLALIEGSFSTWMGGSVIGSYRSGTPGVDRMAGVEVPFEASTVLGRSVRLTAVPMAVFLNSGVLDTTTGTLGTAPVFGTVLGNSNNVYPQQYAVGFGGELQLVTSTFAIAGGYSAYNFLVQNAIGRARWKPGNGHFTLFGGRDPVKETQLSYAGMRDTGQAGPFTQGPIWGGVVQTGGGIRFDSGNEKAGLYIQGEGGQLTGYHVLQNNKYDGTMGAYFRVKVWPGYGSLNVGATAFGEHYTSNERIESYGNGGYFSPNVYFLFAVPITYTGHFQENLHYVINGSVGVQTFQEAQEVYYPLDNGLPLQANCTTTTLVSNCYESALNSNTGLNYSIDAKMSYHVTDHWYIGGFLTGNNTNNYNTISGGFFARYLIRPQAQTVDYPTGLFPVEGFRPLRVP